jgi:hypothetical protein
VSILCVSENETEAAGNDWLVAFDSHVLTYFLDGNKGNHSQKADDPLAEQRVAAVRLFMYCTPIIVPTVKAEASRIRESAKLGDHMQYIDYQFAEFIPYEEQEQTIKQRKDCRHVAIGVPMVRPSRPPHTIH